MNLSEPGCMGLRGLAGLKEYQQNENNKNPSNPPNPTNPNSDKKMERRFFMIIMISADEKVSIIKNLKRSAFHFTILGYTTIC